MKRILKVISSAGLLSLLAGCSSHPPMKTVDYVDLERFMGDWYVIANIPTSIEKNAHNAVENYALNEDGTVATTFTFREGGFDGELKKYQPKGFIKDTQTNALWGMQFVWPVKADYRIVYLDSEYSQTIIGRQARDYVWLMTRSPTISESDYRSLIQVIQDLGYDTSKINRVPQQWSSKEEVSS
jgi:apolipoprotein D and lipocalin family protein